MSKKKELYYRIRINKLASGGEIAYGDNAIIFLKIIFLVTLNLTQINNMRDY